MCFKNLPIEFDSQGKAQLKEGVSNPYTYQVKSLHAEEDQLRTLLAKNGHIKSVDFDPVTRVAGALAFHTVADLKEGKILSANSMATLFRGYEVILKGRDPRDAIFISSRACGVCGGVHATVAAHAMEMAFDIKPPPLGIVVRNMMLALEYLYDHPLHLFLLAGPDYSQAIVEQSNPEIMEKAWRTPAPGANIHGYANMGKLMEDMNPLTGSLYLEALHMTRVAREAYVLLGAKYPHPETIVPGGVSVTITLQTFNEVYARLIKFFDYSKKAAAIWDDLTNFFYDANSRYQEVGSRPMNIIDTGVWDDPYAYDASYKNCNEWGERRWATPGVIIQGDLVTTRLQDINIGVEEFVDHSFYEQWNSHRFKTDPAGNPLSPYHAWNKETIPKPQGQNWKERYTWDTAPRWDRMSVEAGAYARLLITAMAKKLPHNRFIESTGTSLKIQLPRATKPALELEWHVPKTWNAFERNRARAYAIGYTAMVCMDNWQHGMDMLKSGETAVSTKFEIPKKGTHIGAGFWGAGRGFLTHHLVADNGVISNYQINTPSTINASPRDPFGTPGPYEQAVMNTPILEKYSGPENFKGIDVLRAIRSFDPCMPCTTHIHVDGSDRVVSREVNTCACGVD
ncbi:MAG: putative cytochrome C3-like [NiFe] hydrogenase large subunit [Chloroflexi bacterium]|jgi:hydrogenase large subunit|nr:putative cytochrome C3-like [NiFe] hydrogenase large subunit [Chloroflexota bacterium]